MARKAIKKTDEEVESADIEQDEAEETKGKGKRKRKQRIEDMVFKAPPRIDVMPDFSDDPFAILIPGQSTGGKSVMVGDIPEPEGVMCFHTEDKKSPIDAPYLMVNVSEAPASVLDIIEDIVSNGSVYKFDDGEVQPIHTVLIDSLSFLYDKIETHIIPSMSGYSGWDYYRKVLSSIAALCKKGGINLVCTTHLKAIANEQDQVVEYKAAVKGSMKDLSVEAFFDTIVYVGRAPLEDLIPEYMNEYFVPNKRERKFGIKYYCQTSITADIDNMRLRSIPGMFGDDMLYINNSMNTIIQLYEKRKNISMTDIINDY